MCSQCLKWLLVALVLTALPACVNDDESPFARRPAFFRFSPVTAAPKTLLPALNSPGEWAIVTMTPTHYVFKTPRGMSDSYPRTQLDQYGTTAWVSGLIVGTPPIPEIGASGFTPVVYDLVCPSCFDEGGIKRELSFTDIDLGRVSCTRCHRTYDLHNYGIVIEGAASPHDPRLFRYRYTYNNDAFVVHN